MWAELLATLNLNGDTASVLCFHAYGRTCHQKSRKFALRSSRCNLPRLTCVVDNNYTILPSPACLPSQFGAELCNDLAFSAKLSCVLTGSIAKVRTPAWQCLSVWRSPKQLHGVDTSYHLQERPPRGRAPGFGVVRQRMPPQEPCKSFLQGPRPFQLQTPCRPIVLPHLIHQVGRIPHPYTFQKLSASPTNHDRALLKPLCSPRTFIRLVLNL